MSDWTIYDKARRHGLGHLGAMAALDRGKVECWCGSSRVCDGGAQRFVGCPVEWDRFVADMAEAQTREAREAVVSRAANSQAVSPDGTPVREAWRDC